MTAPLIRPANRADLPAINDIYNHYVLNSTCTYQTVPSTMAEREEWFAAHGERHPVIVMESAGYVIGWGSLSSFRARQAFANTVEDSIYLHREHLGHGYGKKILEALLQLAGGLGHHTVLAAVCSEQEPSLELHTKLGFEKIGRWREVGYKFGRWLDLVWMQVMLRN